MPDQNHDCIHEDDFKKLEALVEKVFSRMDVFLDELHKSNISDTATQHKVGTLERDVNILFKDVREVKTEIRTLNDWRQRFDGGIKTMLAIPVFCAVITTVIAVYQLIK